MCMSTLNSKRGENTYPKERALIQMYRVVPQTKIGNAPRRPLKFKVEGYMVKAD